MLGYLKNDEASREAITVDTEGCWVNSGDIGYMNESSDVFIVDKKKDLIKVRSWQVSLAEVESELQQHDDILDVGVIGVPLGDGYSELVRAYVVRRCDSFVIGEELKNFSTRALAICMSPRDCVCGKYSSESHWKDTPSSAAGAVTYRDNSFWYPKKNFLRLQHWRESVHGW